MVKLHPKKHINRIIIFNSLAVSLVTALAMLLAGIPGPNFLSLMKPLSAQASTKAVVFVLGSNCPAGFQDAATAGVSELENNRFPMLVSDPLNNTSGDNQIDNIAGGDAVMTVAQMPNHNHGYTAPGGNRYFTGGGGTWGSYPGVGSGTSAVGSSQPYWLRSHKLRACGI